MRARRRAAPHEEPVSIYEVHLPSWRWNPLEGNRPLSYVELGEELGDYAHDMGFTHVELLPVMAHPFPGSWGYQVTSYFAPSPRQGSPGRAARDDRPPPRARHRRDPRLGAGPLPARRVGAGALRRHGPLRARGPAARRPPRLGHADLQLRPQRGAQLPAWRARSSGCASTTPTACASTRSRRCSTATTRARPASGCPTSTAGARTSRRSASCASSTRSRTPDEPGTIMAAEESTAWPAVSRPTDMGGLGFDFKWNMGWMHDTLEYFAHEPVHRRFHHDELTFSLVYAFTEQFVLPLSHDEVVHGKGSLLSRMPGDDWQRHANLRALYALHVGPPGQEAALHGRRARPGAGVEPRAQPRLAPAGAARATPAAQRLVRDLNHLYRDTPALWQLDAEPGRVPLAGRRRPRRQRGRVRPLRARWARAGRRREPVAGPAHRVPPPPPPPGALARGARTPTPRPTAAPTSATWASSGPRGPWGGEAASAEVTIPPLGVVWLTPDG